MTSMYIDTTQPQASTGSFEPLPTDVYVMKITEATIEENRFAEPDRDGNKAKVLVMVWATERLTAEQEEAGITVGEKVWHRINPYYGTVKDGGPSKFKSFVDSLIEQKLIGSQFDTASLVGIVQRVSVERYIKQQGPNVGQPGNRVIAVAPMQTRRRSSAATPPPPTPQPTEEASTDDETLPF